MFDCNVQGTRIVIRKLYKCTTIGVKQIRLNIAKNYLD